MIKVLRSQAATLVVLTLALLAQLPHAAEVFKEAGHASGVLGWLHSYSYAIALELAVLLFVVQGRRRESYGFAFVSVLVNLAYYAERGPLFSMDALPAWLISLALSIAIALYSHSLAHEEAQAVQHVQPTVQPKVQRVQPLRELASPSHDDAQPIVQSIVQSAEGDAQPDDKVAHAQLLIAQGRTKGEVAQMIGVHRNTLTKLLNTVSA